MHTLIDLLTQRGDPGSPQAARPAFSFLADGANESARIDYATLLQAACANACRIRDVAEPGDRVLLLFPPSIDYVTAYFGTLLAGCVAVPAFPPSSEHHTRRLRTIMQDAGARVALVTEAVAQRLRGHDLHPLGNPDDLHWLVADNWLDTSRAAHWQPPDTGPHDLAMLQYTSGSTGQPKAVMLSHHNLLTNVTLGQQRVKASPGDVGISWLPPYHDFGLIAGIIGSVYAGAHSIQMPSLAFLLKPLCWLAAITRYRARVSGAPNFAYELLLRKVSRAQMADLDLSSLEILVNGAEPIREATLRRFVETFAACGLDPRAIATGYGLAESTLLVSLAWAAERDTPCLTRTVDRQTLGEQCLSSPKAAGEQQRLVCVGQALPGHRVAIVDPALTTALPEGRVGEIWVQGPSVAQGYWQQPEATRSIFQAYAEGLEGPWLRTGDLGVLSDGELLVTGRIKEVMVFNGQNVYPYDIEAMLEGVDPAFRPQATAAFSIEDGPLSRLVVLLEAEPLRSPRTEDLATRLRSALVSHFGITQVEALCVLRAGALPRTSSGKIQRWLCRQWFREQRLRPLWSWPDASPAPRPPSPSSPSEAT